jgi:RsiW-degrading membrane proteinase PrsW (M82 family)
MSLPVRIVTTVLPVVAFLISLLLLDSFKLVRPARLLVAGVIGAAAAFASLFLNANLQTVLGWGPEAFARYAAPLVEEALKAAFLVYLVRARRVGFPVDAAITGFAIGAGFAIVETTFFLNACLLSPLECILRSFGTAIMHGVATALFGVVALTLSERFVSIGARVLLPALGIAYLLHALFNLLLASPVLTVAGLVVVLPVAFIAVFRRSERALRSWLEIGFDADADLLDLIQTGRISESHFGQYLASLEGKFAPRVVADMHRLLCLHAELSLRAKSVLLMKEAGLDVPLDRDDRVKLQEIESLEKSIGRTGMLAMAPLLGWRTRDRWQHQMLGRK